MRCVACGFENDTDSLFCEACGEQLERQCPGCGIPVRADARFCRKCGRRMAGIESATERQAPSKLSLDEKLDQLQRYLPTYLAHKILAGRGRLEGERKVVTVLFADLIGYTPLAERLGEEQLFELMDRVFELLIHGVHRYEGTVNELTGDGVVALFGAPLAVENAPQRAVSAALAMQREMGVFGSRRGLDMNLRIGINTGPVVVGTIGNNLRMDYKAVGDTVNLAARMQQLAEPGAINLTASTHRLVEGYFLTEDLGLVEVKGKAARVQAYRVTGERGRRSRIEVASEVGLTRLVGRERELELLRDCWDRVRAGRGQAFSIIGEAGLGKSRLVHEFRQMLTGDDVTFLEGRCAPYGASIPYLPVIDVLRQNFRLDPGDPGSDAVRKLRDGLNRLGVGMEETLPYLSWLLSLEVSGITPDAGPAGASLPRDLAPEVVRRRTLEAIRALTLRGAELRPLVIVIEDLHWCDKASEELNRFLLEHIAGARVLLLFTHRPEFVAAWPGKSYVSSVNLPRLSNRQTHEMLTALLDAHDIDERLAALVIEKSDGVPFFIEEMVKTLRETGAIEQPDGAWRLSRDIGDSHVPASIEELLTARIDRLPDPARRVLQVGAVIGREFTWELLTKVVEATPMDLIAHLSALKDAELVYERGVYPNTAYVFKHAFTQDVAYETLLASSRRQFHQRVAQAIEARSGEGADEWVPVLAHHFARSGDTDKALRYLVRTGERAARVYANTEAIQAFSEALRILDTRPATEECRRARIDLAIRLGALHELLGHYAESLAVAMRALELAEAFGEEPVMIRLENHVADVRYSMGDVSAAIAWLQRALERAERIGDARGTSVSYRHLGTVHFSSGSLARAATCFMKALEISEKAQNQVEVATACILLANAQCRMGDLKDAVAWGRRALQLSEQAHDERRGAWARIMLYQALVQQGEFGELTVLNERARSVFERVGDFRGRAWAMVMHGFLAEAQQEHETGIELRRQMVTMSRESGGFRHELSATLARQAADELRLGRLPEALEHAQESLRIALAMGNKLEYGYAYMVLAEIHAQEEYRDWARASWYFEESLKAFREVGAQLDVARAYLAGARISLLKADGKAPELAQMGRDVAAARGAGPLAEEAEEILAHCRKTQSS